MATQSKRPKIKPVGTVYEATSDGGRRAYLQALTDPKDIGRMNRTATAAHLFQNVSSSGVSVTDGFDRVDYDWFRPDAVLPTDPRDVIDACMQAKDNYPFVRNVFELMSDFAVKGLDVVHPSPTFQKFGKEWLKKAGVVQAAHQMADGLFTAAVVPITRLLASIPEATLSQFRQTDPHTATARFNPPVALDPGQIPLGYVLRDPRLLEITKFTADPRETIYALRAAKTDADDKPKLSQVNKPRQRTGKPTGPLVKTDPKRFAVAHYRKADYKAWARPLLYAVIRDLQMYEKLRLADLSALDNMTQYVRLWTVGNLEYEIYPTAAVIQRVSDLLLNSSGGGGKDLIFGPELSFTETSTDAHQFLGEAKYRPTLTAIYQGLGIPPALSGVGDSGPTTNAFISLKVLTERLQYAREVLRTFWEGEFELLRVALNIAQPFTVVFDYPDLTDEAASKKLLMDLVDRGLVSAEFVQDRFGAVPEIEQVRLKREAKLREKGKAPAIYSPFNPTNGQNSAADEGGRPVGRKDSTKRKTRVAKPVTSPVAVARANEAREAIDAIVRPLFLKLKSKTTVRSLTAVEAADLEQLVFAVLCETRPGEAITEEGVLASLEKGAIVPPLLEEACLAALSEASAASTKPLSRESERLIRVGVWCSSLEQAL